MTIARIIFCIFIIICAGRFTLANRIFGPKKYPPFLALALYFAAGSVTLSLYMILLSVLNIKFGILSIGLPFILYFMFNIPRFLSELKIKPGIPKIIDHGILYAIALILLFLVTLTLAINNMLLPVFRADALGGWVFRAKVFFFERTIPLELFVKEIFCNTADYPVLIPLNLAWVSICTGKWEDTTVRIFFTMQYISCLYIFYCFLKEHIGSTKSLMGTLISFTIPNLLNNIETAYADFSLAFYVLLSAIFLHKWMNNYNDDSDLFIAAFFIGAAALTKNDGIGLFLAILITLTIYVYRNISRKTLSLALAFRKLCIFAFTSAAVFIPYKVITLAYGLKSHMTPGNNVLFQMSDILSRLPQIIAALSYELFADTYFWVYFWIYFVIFLALSRKRLLSNDLLYIFLFVSLSVAMYMFTYLIVPDKVFIFLDSTVNRLLLGLAPTAGFLMFSAAFCKDDVKC